MGLRRTLATILGTLALVGWASGADAQHAGQPSSAVTTLRDAPHAEPEQPVTVDAEVSVDNPNRRLQPSDVSEATAIGLTRAKRQSRNLQGDLERLHEYLLRQQAAFAGDDEELPPGVVVPQRVLDGYRREIDGVQQQFRRVQRGFERLGRRAEAVQTGRMISLLDELRARLAPLGLELVESSERVRVANELRLDLDLLEQRREELPEFMPDRFAEQPDIIRPPEGIEPSREIIRPPEGIEPSREIIRPPEGIKPSQQIIRPPTSDNPAGGD